MLDTILLQHPTTGLATFALVLALVQLVKIRFLSRCHFGVLAASALRWQLRLWSLLRKRCAIIGIDIRKLHDLNEVLGYDVANALVGLLVRMRNGRRTDIVGQYGGGDEFIIALSDTRAGELVVARLIARMAEITEQMPAEQRAALVARTNGLVDGLCAAIVLIPETRDAYGAAVRAITATGEIKAGVVTGDRSTSGKAGTQTAVLGGAI